MNPFARKKPRSFKGGIHPPDKKDLSKDVPITRAEPPSHLVISMLQNVGAPSRPVVDVGQKVKKGQLLAEAQGFISTPLHAPVSGKIVAIDKAAHPSGNAVQAVSIENDYADTWIDLVESKAHDSLSSTDLSGMIQCAGIVGMGGAAFPTHVKLQPPAGKPIDALIINGAECEPYLTADHRLMLEKTSEIIEGVKICMKVLGISRAYIGIEANKADVVEIMKAAVGDDPRLSVHTLAVKYPQGAEKIIIKSMLAREVPFGGLPMDVGVVVQNVATVAAIYSAVRFGLPLIERVVTVSGEGIARPKNLLAPIGTPVRELIDQCGGFTAKRVYVIHGGPIMGRAIESLDVPIVKGTSGIVVLPAPAAGETIEHGPCLRCARCQNICPMGLNPAALGILAEKELFDELIEQGIELCFECGSCAYACPSLRPVANLIHEAKVRIKSLKPRQTPK